MVVSNKMHPDGNDRKRPAVDKTTEGAKRKKTPASFTLTTLKGSLDAGIRTNDTVHRSIAICPVMEVFMKTRQFQRLAKLKQLGTSDTVFMNANHTRKEHSLGVAQLANMLCRRIKHEQPDLKTTEKDVLCVKLAGLLHDIGHGPFSHVFESFREMVDSDISNDASMEKLYSKFPKVQDGWKHEDSSLFMIDSILESLGLRIDVDNLDEPLEQIGDGIDARSMRVYQHRCKKEKEADIKADILTSRDLVFVKECIYGGKPLPELKEEFGDRRIGREEPHKEWLYDIVANRYSGLDVDKIDYLARDQARTIGGDDAPDTQALYGACVAKAKCSKEGCDTCRERHHFMICYPKKNAISVIRFFKKRFEMHNGVYQHKTTVATSFMICDILRAADLHFLRPSKKFGELPISRAVLDPYSFMRLIDSIINEIDDSESESLAKAKAICDRLERRDLYKLAGEHVISHHSGVDARLWMKKRADIAHEIVGIHGHHNDENENPLRLQLGDICVDKCVSNHGLKDMNPLLQVRFLMKKGRLDGPIEDYPEAKEVDEKDYEEELPRSFQRRAIRVFTRDSAKRDLLRHAFDHWILNQDSVEQTPDDGKFEVVRQPDEASVGNDSDQDSFGGRGRTGIAQPTQDSEDDGTPMKRHERDVQDQSPITVPMCRF